MPTNDKPTGNRRNVPLYVTMPPEERDRVAAFARNVGRPLSWAVRDGLRLYLDAVEGDAAALARVKVDPSKAGKTKPPRRGRPRKGYGVPLDLTPAQVEALGKLDPAAMNATIQALLAELERNPTAAPKGKGKANVR